MIRFASVLAIASLIPGAASAADLPDDLFATPQAEEVLDLVVFGEARPAFVRLRIRMEGRGFRRAWADYVARLHADLDGDGDGTVTEQEANRPLLSQILGQGIPPRPTTPAKTPVSRAPGLDSDQPDGTITIGELERYLRVSRRLEAIAIQAGPPPDRQTQALFGHLDRDDDGALSSGEIEGSGASLARLDHDEDDVIQLAELIPYQNPYASRFGAIDARMGSDRTKPPDLGPIAVLSPGMARRDAARRLLLKYDQSAEATRDFNKLSPAELGVDPAAFPVFDRDGDGLLNQAELEAFLARPTPGLDLVIDFGRRGSRWTSPEVGPADGPPMPLASAIRKSRERNPILNVEGMELEFRMESSTQDLRAFYAARFGEADADKNDYVDESEAMRDNFFRMGFAAIDRDGDGKVFRAELDAYADQQSGLANSRTTLTVADRGQPLFDLLDADHDRRLERRELRSAPQVLGRVDANGDGRITAAELPRRYLITLGRGQPPDGGSIRGGIATGTDITNRASIGAKGGPAWFRAMDRNADGDVSSREFLGPRDAFRDLDADGDGLIDVQEATGQPG